MTRVEREQAIEVLQAKIDSIEDDQAYSQLSKSMYEDGYRRIDACKAAIAALRDMLKRREGCDFCNESEQIQNQYGDIMEMDDGVLILDTEGYPKVTFRIKYCPDCGRKLEEEG